MLDKDMLIMTEMADNHIMLPSSQSSMTELKLEAKENAYSMPKSSPLKPSKPRRPPTVTPKRFNRFFTPRSSVSNDDIRNSRSGRFLKDITNRGCSRQPVPANKIFHNDFPDLRSAKRPRFSEAVLSSSPQSSPIKHDHGSQMRMHCEDSDNEGDDFSIWSDREPDLPGLEDDEEEDQAPPPITKLNHKSTTSRLLSRSFGAPPSASYLRNGHETWPATHANATKYCTVTRDMFSFRRPRALCFSIASCNTNSLVACGDEDGSVFILDTAEETDFSQPHISFRAHKNAIMDLTFSPCDSLLATGGGDQTARIIDMQTQSLISVLTGHKSSVKQIRFRPEQPKLLTTSGRDGMINVWDLRCKEKSVQTLSVGGRPIDEEWYPLPTHRPAYASMVVGPAHRVATAADQIYKSESLDAPWLVDYVSITSIEHLPGSRSHLLLSASEQNASLKLFDLRVAGRNTKSDRFHCEIPVACTAPPPDQTRHYGVAALVLSTDGARAYSLCKDSTIWAYSTQHLILGSAPESLKVSKRTRISPPEKPKESLGPLYGLRDPRLLVGSFYNKAAIRRGTSFDEEMLAVSSSDHCAVLFPTDERSLRKNESEASAGATSTRPRSFRRLFSDEPATPRVPIFDGTGTALVRGHTREVTSLTFAAGGELVTTGDDFRARCWRQDEELAQYMRVCGEGEGKRWGRGWAAAPTADYDECEA